MFAKSHIGHHSTYQEKKLKQRYPKPIRHTIKKRLTVEQWRRFDAALHGWYSPSNGERALWDHVAGISRLSGTTVAIGFPNLHIQVSRGSGALKEDLLTGGAAIAIGSATQTPR